MHNIREKICLIVPCFNEENRLQMECFLAGPEYCKFLFVNDGSTDQTAKLIRNNLNKKIFLLDLKQNVGKAEAVRLGMLYALTNDHLNKDEWIGFWDSDLATPLSETRGFLNFMEFYGPNVQAIWGSRIHRLGSEIHRSCARHMLGRLFASVAAFMIGIESYDSQCGAKLFKKEIVKLAFSEKFISRWIFDIELLLRLRQYEVIEYPLQSWSDIAGSKINFYSIIPIIIRDLFIIRKKYGKSCRTSDVQFMK